MRRLTSCCLRSVWTRNVAGVLLVLGVAVGCSGRSSKSERNESTGGRAGGNQSAGAGSGGELGGTSASGTAGVGAPVGGVSSVGGVSGVGGSSGSSGTSGSGGSFGGDCACETSMCTVSLEYVCYRPFGCGVDLDRARREITEICGSFSGGAYEECAGGVAHLDWIEGLENAYDYVFDETGELVFVEASGQWVAPAGCSTGTVLWNVTAGMRPPLTDCRGCSICMATAERPGCVTDAEGRIALPP
jgi:hypothetical protein